MNNKPVHLYISPSNKSAPFDNYKFLKSARNDHDVDKKIQNEGLVIQIEQEHTSKVKKKIIQFVYVRNCLLLFEKLLYK